jgi:hypothetical protein
MVPALSGDQQLIYRRLLELVRKHASLDARVAIRKNEEGDIVMAIVVPTVPGDGVPRTSARRAKGR